VTIVGVAPSSLSAADAISRTVTLKLDLQDDLSGMGGVRIVRGDTFETAPWEAYAPVKQVIAQPGDVIYVFYRDVAGNESLDPFELDVPGNRTYLYVPLILR